MGKITENNEDEGEDVDEKKKKTKQSLQRLRRNALTAKYNLRHRAEPSKPPKTQLTKALNAFASKREEMEHALHDKKINEHKPRISERLLPEPDYIPKGFFLGAMKTKIETHSHLTEDEFRKAILESDVLKLSREKESFLGLKQNKTNYNKHLRPKPHRNVHPIEDISKDMSNVIHERDNLTNNHDINSSPSLCTKKNLKKKIHLPKKPNDDGKKEISNNEPQGEKQKRRLFRNNSDLIDILEFSPVRQIENEKEIKGQEALRFSPRKPIVKKNLATQKEFKGNMLTNHFEKKPSSSSSINIDNLLFDTLYLETSEYVNSIFDEFVAMLENDPLDKVRSALNKTYTEQYKLKIKRDMENSSESDEVNEPGSTIRIQQQLRHAKVLNDWRINRSADFNDMIDQSEGKNLVNDPSIRHSVDADNIMKRKRVPSSKNTNSESECYSTIIEDPGYTSVDKSKEQMITRYLEDVQESISQEAGFECFKNAESQTDFSTGHSSLTRKEAHLSMKNHKHKPTILRKNNPMVELLTKKHFLFSSTSDSRNPELTPLNKDNEWNKNVSAPISTKMAFLNAKYNQPPRINFQFYNKKSEKNIFKGHFFPTPEKKEFFQSKKLTSTKGIDQSTIVLTKKKSLLCNGEKSTKEDYDRSSSNHPIKSYINRNINFGEIQEKTNKLSISPDDSREFPEEKHYTMKKLGYSRSDGDVYDFDCENDQSFGQVPKLFNQTFLSLPSDAFDNNIFSKNSGYKTSNSPHQHCCNTQKYHYNRQINQNHYSKCNETYPENKMYPVSNFQTCNGQISHQAMIPQQISRQPVKYIAIGEKKLTEKKPIYGLNDNHQCIHKTDQVVNYIVHPANSNNATQYYMPEMQHNNQEHPGQMCSRQIMPRSMVTPQMQSNYNCILPANRPVNVHYPNSNTVPSQAAFNVIYGNMPIANVPSTNLGTKSCTNHCVNVPIQMSQCSNSQYEMYPHQEYAGQFPAQYNSVNYSNGW